MKSKLLLTKCLLMIFQMTFSQDWSSIPVPASAGSGYEWELQENVSDDFNYTFNPVNSKTNFGGDKWYNFYHNQWDGPGTTYWKYNQVQVDGNQLVLKASRWDKANQANPQYPYPGAWEDHKMSKPNNGVNAACITSNNKVQYPVYVESSISVANIALASCFWLLSPDDTQEIDIIENYGGVSGFKHLTHISHHSFIRDPFHDYQPRDWNSWWPDDRVNSNYGWGDWCWNEGHRQFMRLGVYWISPKHFEYYVDGQLVRVLYNDAIATNMSGQWQYTYYDEINPANTQDAWRNNVGGQPVNNSTGYQTGYSKVTTYATGNFYSFDKLKEASDASNKINVVDPGEYQGGTGFTKEMDIIINVESQSWLVSRNETPSDADLLNSAKNEMRVDWVRVYKPVASDGETFIDDVSCNNLPVVVDEATTYIVQVPYSASTPRDLNVTVIDPVNGTWYGEGQTRVSKGEGLASVTVNILSYENGSFTSTTLDPSLDYVFRVALRPEGGTWEDNIKACDSEELIIGTVTSTLDQESKLVIAPNPTEDFVTIDGEFDHWSISDITGVQRLAGQSKVIDLSELCSGTYFIRVDNLFTETIYIK